MAESKRSTLPKPGQKAKPKRPKKKDHKDNKANFAPDKYPLTVNNMVFTAILNHEVDLITITHALNGSCVERGFPAAVVKSHFPSAAINVFSSGTMVISGAGSPDDALLIAWQLCYRLTRLLRVTFRPSGFRVVNMVGSVGVGHKIDRDLLLNDYPDIAMFQPDSISHVSITPFVECNMRILVYESGKCVVTGGLHREQLSYAFDQFDFAPYALDKPYRVLDPVLRKTSVFAN